MNAMVEHKTGLIDREPVSQRNHETLKTFLQLLTTVRDQPVVELSAGNPSI